MLGVSLPLLFWKCGIRVVPRALHAPWHVITSQHHTTSWRHYVHALCSIMCTAATTPGHQHSVQRGLSLLATQGARKSYCTCPCWKDLPAERAYNLSPSLLRSLEKAAPSSVGKTQSLTHLPCWISGEGCPCCLLGRTQPLGHITFLLLPQWGVSEALWRLPGNCAWPVPEMEWPSQFGICGQCLQVHLLDTPLCCMIFLWFFSHIPRNHFILVCLVDKLLWILLMASGCLAQAASQRSEFPLGRPMVGDIEATEDYLDCCKQGPGVFQMSRCLALATPERCVLRNSASIQIKPEFTS